MQVVICAAIAAIGAENLLCAHVSQLVFAKNLLAVPVLPFVPAIPIFVYLVGMALLAGGVSVAASIRPRFASIFLGLFFLLWVLVLLVPKAIARPLDLNVRMCVFEVLALGSSALTLAGCLQEEHGPTVGSILGRLIDKLIASAPYLFAMSSVVFGVTHFLIPRIIVSLEPDWSLAACSGHTSRARGSSLLVSASQAASWRGGLFGWGSCFYSGSCSSMFPRVAIHPRIPAEWSSAFIAHGLCGGSWICAWHSLRSQETPEGLTMAKSKVVRFHVESGD